MSRAAMLDALINDARLQALGFTPDNIVVNYDDEQRPAEGQFIVLGWGTEDTALRGNDIVARRFKNLTVFVHIQKIISTDFNRVDDILAIIDDIYQNMIHVAGADGETVTLVEVGGRSRDMRDDSYETICRSSSYRILSRETASV